MRVWYFKGVEVMAIGRSDRASLGQLAAWQVFEYKSNL